LSEGDLAAIDGRGRSSPAGPAWRVWAATIALGRGERERAREAVRREADDLPALPRNTDWLYTAAMLGVLAAHLGEVDAAAVVYPLVRPHGHRTITSGRATTCMGSVSLPLGLLAAALEDDEAAVGHLEEAVRRNDAMGATPYAAAARRLLADLVDDESRAEMLRREADAARGLVAIGLPAEPLARR
jgi:hypothetical protein